MTITLHAPQIIYLLLGVFTLAMSAIKHGKPRSNENFFATFVGVVLGFALLYWGGFFN